MLTKTDLQPFFTVPLLFIGPGVGGFSSLSIVGTHISIMLQQA